eukprot:TRINITY_DN37267_c0_g1_i1.p1 TRINITY_DN37267_c0_g1~~TRINITY_DN37267_c0_g1_i1.p1  ORF type:complete len:352 (+),score=61.61 TRINITY_DN37267_c0_g1_i1:101-1156(+)
MSSHSRSATERSQATSRSLSRSIAEESRGTPRTASRSVAEGTPRTSQSRSLAEDPRGTPRSATRSQASVRDSTPQPSEVARNEVGLGGTANPSASPTNHRLLGDHFCQRWERFADDVVKSVAVGKTLPTPPSTASGLPGSVARVSEAALAALAALWMAETEARALRRQVADCMGGSELNKLILQERARNLELRKRDVSLTERIAAARAEVHVQREQGAELALARAEGRSEVCEARVFEEEIKEANRGKEEERERLRKLVAARSRRLEALTRKEQDARASLKESELRCERLQRELFESERERKRMLDVVQGVITKTPSNSRAQSPPSRPSPPLSSRQRDASPFRQWNASSSR